MPEYTLEDLAAKLGLTLKGGNAKVSGLNTLEAAGPDEVSFLANPKYAPFLAQTRACAVIVDAAHADKVERALISKTPYLDFGRALALFARSEGSFKGISDQAYIDPQAILGAGCTVYPFAYIGARARLGKNCVLFSGAYVGEDAVIGDNCRLYPNAVVLSRVEMGEGCELHPGAVLGSDGFGFTRQTNVMGGASGAGESGGANGGDSIQRIPQAGFVRLGKAVSVGSNAAIDRGALGPTCIGDETKIDNLVQIGHNVTVGKAGLVVSQVGVSGSSRIGDRVTLAGQAGIAGHLKIGNDVVIGPQSGVAKDVPDGFQGGGSPLVDGQTFLRTLSLMPKLPELFKRLSRLEKELAELRGAVEK